METMTETNTLTETESARHLTSQRRAEICRILRLIAEPLAARHGVTVIEPALEEMSAEVWLWGLASSLLGRRRPALLDQAHSELDAVLMMSPQTAGGKAFQRCYCLLIRLLLAEAKRDGLL